MLTFPEIEDPGDEPIKWLRSLIEGAIYERETVTTAIRYKKQLLSGLGCIARKKLLTFEIVCLHMTSEYE